MVAVGGEDVGSLTCHASSGGWFVSLPFVLFTTLYDRNTRWAC